MTQKHYSNAVSTRNYPPLVRESTGKRFSKIFLYLTIVFLVATLFVSPGSALTDGQTVFVYENISGLEGEWTCGAYTISAQSWNGYGYFAGENIVEGWYTNGNLQIHVLYPSATITGVAKAESLEYIVIGGSLYKGDEVTFTASSLSNNVDVVGFLVTYPNGVALENFGLDTPPLSNSITLSTETLQSGTYRIQAIFDREDFVSGTPANYLYSKSLYSFTVTEEPDITLSSNVECVMKGEIISLTITGKPGAKYTINPGTYFAIESFGVVEHNGNEITIPNNGKGTIYLKAIDKGVGKISIESTGKFITIQINEPTISVDTNSASIAIGDDVTLSGTYTSNTPLYFYIDGNGKDFTALSTPISPNYDSTWSKTIAHSELFGGEITAGSYTIYVSTTSDVTSKEMLGVYNTITLQMREPIFTFKNAPSVVAQGYTYEVIGTAENADDVQLYIFGADFFTFARYNHQTIGDLSGNIISIANGVFDIEFGVTTDKMPTGQYTMIVQHPGQNKVFNVYADELLNIRHGEDILFNINDRDDPAKTLEEVFPTENIDDTYIKTTFSVGAPSFSINNHPSELTRGSILPISGSTPLGKETLVNVELSKSSAANLILTTKTNDDGDWKVAFDTTGLDLGEYTITVRIGTSDPLTSKVTIIEATPIDKTKDTINLYTGWNFISIPKYLATSCETAGDLFANINTGGNAILGYDGKTGWYQIMADTKIEPLNGYFVYVTNPTTLTFTYSTNIKNTPPTKQVYTGWNAVGLSAKGSLSAKSTFAGLDWNRYIPWDEEALGNPIINGGSAQNSEENLVFLKEGGWLYLKADGVYVGNTV